MMAVLSCFVVVKAEQQTNYVETFSKVDTSVTGFHPLGWGHKFYSSYYYSYAATYSKETTDPGETYLTCKQYYPNMEAYDDCLVSPVVSGKVTLDAKIVNLATTGTAGVKFYKFTENNGNYTKGTEITPDVLPELNENEFQTIVFNNVDPSTRIGIRAHNAAFKNFTAATADVVPFEELKVGIAIKSTDPEYMTQSSKKYVNLNPDGKYSVTFTVQLTNNGEVDYDSNTQNFTLKLTSNNKELATVAIKDAIPAGQKVTNTYTFELNGNESTGTENFYIYENVDGKNDNDYDTLYLIPWHSEFLLQSGKTTSSVYNVKNGAIVDFGSTQTVAGKTYYIYNQGTAPLTFSGTVSDGFTVNFPEGTEVEAGGYVPVEFGITDTPFGAHSGSIQFTSNATDYPAFTLNLKGVVLDPSKYYENFSSGSMPKDMVSGQDGWSFQAGQASNTSGYTARMILPKLTVKTGEEFLITSGRASTYSYQAPALKVYKSADRQDWTLVKEFGAGDYPSTTDYTSLTIDGVEPGDWYLAIDGTYSRIKELYGYEKTDLPFDVMATGQNVPATGEVNSTFTAQFTVKNPGKALAASDYKAVMKVNGTEVAAAETKDIAQGASATFSFSYVPHAVGSDLPVELSLVYLSTNSQMAKSAPATINILEEMLKSEIVVGQKTTNNLSEKIIYGSGSFAWSDILFDSSKLNLEPGTKINRIAFKGTSSGTPIASTMKVWLENTELTTLKNSWKDPEEEPTFTFVDHNLTPNADEDVFVLDMRDNPFVYDGDNIRIRIKLAMSSRSSIKIYKDNSTGSSYYDYESSDRTSTTLYGSDVPVMYISVEAEPTVVSGKVTDASTGSAVEGAKVTMKAGDIEYYATSGEEGDYSVTLLKAIDGYSINVEAEGYFPYSNPVDISEGNVIHNVSLQQARGISIPEFSIPTSGTVNNPMTVTALVRNYDATSHEGYTLNLYVDGVNVKTIEGTRLAGNNKDFTSPDAEKSYTFAYTPNEEGKKAAYLTIEWNDVLGQTTYTSSTVNMEIEPEVGEGMVIVGTPNSFGTYAPVYPYYDASESETIYTAEDLGLPAGSELLSLCYKGYYNSQSLSLNVQVWMKNVDGERAASDRFNRDDMTLVYDNSAVIPMGGSESQPADMLNLKLDEPFKYEGKDLCIIVRGIAERGSTCYFEADDRYGSYARYAWDESSLPWASQIGSPRPVVRIGFDNKLIHTGTVKSLWLGGPVEGAKVTLSSGDVRYYATTDENGEYEIPVVQKDLPYTLTVEHYQHYTYTKEGIDLTEPAYIQLEVNPVTGIDTVTKAPAGRLDPTQPMYDVTGRRVSESYRGIVIQNGRKYIKN